MSNNSTTAPSVSPSPNNKQAPQTGPLTPELLFAITELAKTGLSYLREIVSSPDFKIEMPDPKESAEKERHLRVLALSAGPAAVKHFDLMCQYIVDSAKKQTEPAQSPSQTQEKGDPDAV